MKLTASRANRLASKALIAYREGNKPLAKRMWRTAYRLVTQSI